MYEKLELRHFHLGMMSLCLLLHVIPASIIGTIPYIKSRVAQEYSLGNATVAWLSSGTVFVGVFGALASGWLADHFGRRPMFATSAAAALILALLQQASWGEWGWQALLLWQSLLGLPFGCLAALTVPYLLEFSADQTRGLMGVVVTLGWPVGSIYSLLVVQAVGAERWRLCLLAPTLPSLAFLACLPRVPESPRWLYVAGRTREAEEALGLVLDSPPLFGSDAATSEPARRPPLPEWRQEQPEVARRLRELVSRRWRAATATAVALYVCVASQSYALWVFGPEIIEASTGRPAPLWVFVLCEASGVAATLVACATVDRAGRRPLMIVGFLMALMVVAAFACRPPLASACAAWQLGGFSQSLMWAPAAVFVSEVFPTHLRGTGNGLVSTFMRIAAGVFPLLMGAALSQSILLALCVVATPLFAGLLVVTLLLHETAGTATSD